MKKAKKLFQLFFIFMLISTTFMFSGCKKNSTEKQTITLGFLSWYNETTMDPVLKAFKKKNPNIKIDLQYAPPIQNYIQKFQVLYSSNSLPDIFVTSAENKNDVMNNKMAKDLTSLPNVANLSEANKKTYTDDNGKLIAFAPDGWFAGIFVNKTLLREKGLNVPANYSEYIAAMRTLKSKGIEPWAFSSTNLYDPLQGYVETETISKDADYDKKVDSGKLKYKDGWTVPIQKWYDDYVKTGYANKADLGITGDQAMQEWATGKAAFTVGATWNPVSVAKLNPKLDYTLLPWFGTDNKTTYLTGAAGVGWSINSKTTHSDEAMTFLKYLTSNEGIQLFEGKANGVVAVKGIDYTIDAHLKDCYPYFTSGKIYLPAVSWKYSDALGDILLKYSQNIVGGSAKPEDLITAMDKKWTDLEAAS